MRFISWKRFFAYLLGYAGIGFAHWMRVNFGHPSVEQILYHVYFAEENALGMSQVFFLSLAVEVVALPLVGALLSAWLHEALLRHEPGLRRHLRPGPWLAVAGGLAALLLQVPIVSYAMAHLQPDRFATAYVPPATAHLAQGERRNLVLIYVESLEATYSDAALFGTDLLAPLNRLGGQAVPGYGQAHGTNWTMAGLVASQCGVPLNVNSPWDLKRRSPAQKAYLPGAVCLGDVLKAHGYRNVFLGGASLAFAGKGTFLRDHGFDALFGREEWMRARITAGHLGFWGLHDDELLAQAKRQLRQLHAAGQPFNLTVLTVDTHGPDGFMSDSCRRQGAQDFRGVVQCTGLQLADFVQFVQREGYLKDTVVVILGDHLAMGNALQDSLAQAADRRIYSRVFAREPVHFSPGPHVPFDMFPTLLELLDFRLASGRLGLGYSALRSWPAGSRPEALSESDLQALVGSSTYAGLWSAEAATDTAAPQH